MDVARVTREPRLLQSLSEDDKFSVRINVAGNIYTPPEALSRLADDDRFDVRFYAAQNPNTPLEKVEKLTQDEDESVRGQAEMQLALRQRLALQQELSDSGLVL